MEEKKEENKEIAEVKKEETNLVEQKEESKEIVEVKEQETKPAEKKEESKTTTVAEKEEPKKETNSSFKTTNKKVETSKTNSKNNNVIIAIIAVIAVVAVICIALSMQKKDSPKQAVENKLKDLKTGTYTQEMLSELLLQGEGEYNTEMAKLFFEKLEWKVLKVEEDGDKATVEVEITNKDFKTIMGNYMQKALKVALSGNVNEEEMKNFLMEELKNQEIQTVTNNKSITVQKKDEKWEVEEDEEFVNGVFPGLSEAINALM